MTFILAENHRNYFSHSSEDVRSKIKLSAGPCSLDSSTGELFFASSYLLVVARNPWNFLLRAASLQSVPIVTWSSSLCLIRVFQSPSPYKTTSHIALGLTIIHYDLFLTWLHLQRHYFEIRSHSQLLGYPVILKGTQ